MAGMVLDCILKKIALTFFQVYRFYLEKLAKTLIMVYFLLENSIDIFLLVFHKHFCVRQRYLVLI